MPLDALVEVAKRRERGRTLLGGYGYVGGPMAGPTATARALTKVGDASAIVLVEGLSDQIALETLAVRRGRDLESQRVVVLPVGGAHAIRRFLTRFGPEGAGVRLAGLCDVGEEEVFRRGLAGAGIGAPTTRAAMERLGFFVCVSDLEDELIRAVGAEHIEALFEAHGDLGPFRTLQRQAAWRGQSVEAQMWRFFGSGGTRKLRYARILVEAVDLGQVPRPLDAVLAEV